MSTAPFLPAGTPAQLLPARELMGFTLAAHITLVPLGVALPFVTPVMHHRGLRRNGPVAVPPARRRSAVTAVRFAVGTVTGTVLSFGFGLLWPGMTGRREDVPYGSTISVDLAPSGRTGPCHARGSLVVASVSHQKTGVSV